MQNLTAVRDALALVDGVKTCRIGMEAGITPDDYPMVRVVPSRIEDTVVLLGAPRKCEALIYFGVPVHEFADGLEALYSRLFDMEAALLAAMRSQTVCSVKYLETILDEDKVEAFKLMALRVELVG